MTEQTDNIKNVLDSVAIFSTFGAFLEMFNPLFALVGAVVGVMRIYEMATGKQFYTLFRKKKDDDAEHK